MLLRKVNGLLVVAINVPKVAMDDLRVAIGISMESS